jgi:hypothetical protein
MNWIEIDLFNPFLFVNRPQRMKRLTIVWLFSSYGYHGDDGNVFHNRGDRGTPYGPKYVIHDH